MNWTEARGHARAGRRVRRIGWRDRWITFERALYYVQPVDRWTLMDGLRRVVHSADWSPGEFTATDWTLDPIPPTNPDPNPALGSVTLSDAFSEVLVSFGIFAAGVYRVVYEQGAIYYVAADKSQLRINAYSTSANGYKIRSGGVDIDAPGDSFKYTATDSRTEAELLADIASRSAGADVTFTHPGGDISMWLSDPPYTDNAPSAQMPRFSLYAGG